MTEQTAPTRKPLNKGTHVMQYLIVFEYLYAGTRRTGNAISHLDYKKEIDEEFDIRAIESAMVKKGYAEAVLKDFKPLKMVKIA